MYFKCFYLTNKNSSHKHSNNIVIVTKCLQAFLLKYKIEEPSKCETGIKGSSWGEVEVRVGMRLGGWVQARGAPRGGMISKGLREATQKCPRADKGVREAGGPWQEGALWKHSEVLAQGKGILEPSLSEASRGGQHGDSEGL